MSNKFGGADVGGIYEGSQSPIISANLGSPAAASATAVHAAVTLANGAPTTVTTAITNPDVPRNLTVKGNAAGVTGNVTFIGTDEFGQALTETIAASGTAEVPGVKAFKTVTSYSLPQRDDVGDTISIGRGSKLGLGAKLTRDSVVAAFLAGTREGTHPTVVVSASDIAANTVQLSSSLNGTAVIVDFYRS